MFDLVQREKREREKGLTDEEFKIQLYLKLWSEAKMKPRGLTPPCFCFTADQTPSVHAIKIREYG